MSKIIITENEKNEILNLYKSRNIILEARGGKIGRKLTRLLGNAGMENAGALTKALLSGNRDYYIYSIAADGTYTLRRGQYDKEEFLDFIEDFTNRIEDGTLSMTTKEINDFFVNLFLKNDADFTVKFITDRIENLKSSDPQFPMRIDFISDLIDKSLNNDLFRTYFPVESTYFKKVSDLIKSDDFIDAGPSEKLNQLKAVNTKPTTLSKKDLRRLAGEQNKIKYAREIVEILKGFRKSTRVLKSEINDLISAYAAGDFVNTTQYGKQILLKLNELENRANDAGKNYLRYVKKQLEESGDPNLEELKIKLDTMDDGKAFKKLRDTAPQDVRESLTAAAKDMLEVLPFRRNSDGKLSLIEGLKSGQFWMKFLTFMSTGQFITPKDIYNTMIKSAGSSGKSTSLRTFRNLYIRAVAGKLMFPALNLVFWGLFEPTLAWMEDGINNSNSWLFSTIRDWRGESGKIDLTDFDRDEFASVGDIFIDTFNKQVRERWREDGVTAFDVDDFFVNIEPIWPSVLELFWGANSPDAAPVQDLPVVDATAYRDNISSFNNWLEDNDIEKKTTSIPKRLDDGAYEVTLKGDNTPTYYIYDNNTFKQD